MSVEVEEQIRRGLRLVAEELEAPATAWAPARPRRRLVAAAAGLALLAAASALGILGRGSGTAPRFLVDGFDYEPGPALSYQPGGIFRGSGGPVPLFTLADLTSLSVASHGAAWIVGSVAWRWNGRAWQQMPLPKRPGLELDAVSAVSRNDAWIVGSRGVYRAHFDSSRAVVDRWNGTRWKAVPLPVHRNAKLFAISASGPRNVWAAGATFRRDKFGRFSQRGTRPLLLHWNGASWRTVRLPWARAGLDLGQVVVNGPASVWVVSFDTQLLEHWNGVRWQSVPAPFGPADPFSSFSATSGRDGWAVGSYGVGTEPARHSFALAAHWNGHSWQIAPVPNRPGNTDSELGDVAEVNAHDAWAIGQTAHLTFTKTKSGESIEGTNFGPLFEHWDGRSWQLEPGVAPRPEGAFGFVAAASDGTVWTVGGCYADNVIARWTGRAWQVTAHPPDQRWRPGVVGRFRKRGFPKCSAASR